VLTHAFVNCGGAAAQDAAAEVLFHGYLCDGYFLVVKPPDPNAPRCHLHLQVLFHGYFAEGKAPSDENTLRAALVAAGETEEAAAAFVADDSDAAAAATREELQLGRGMGVRGVPHFVVRAADVAGGGGGAPGAGEPLSGAQPPEAFEQAFARAVAPAPGGGGGGGGVGAWLGF